MKKLFLLVLFTGLSLNAMDSPQVQQPKHALVTLDQLLPQDIWEHIARFLPANKQFLNELIRHFDFGPEIYNKIAKAFAQTLEFYPHAHEVDSLVNSKFKTTHAQNLHGHILHNKMKRALMEYVRTHDYAYFKDIINTDKQNIIPLHTINANQAQFITTFNNDLLLPSRQLLNDTIQAQQARAALSRKELKELRAKVNEYIFLTKRCLTLVNNTHNSLKNAARYRKAAKLTIYIPIVILLWNILFGFEQTFLFDAGTWPNNGANIQVHIEIPSSFVALCSSFLIPLFFVCRVIKSDHNVRNQGTSLLIIGYLKGVLAYFTAAQIRVDQELATR